MGVRELREMFELWLRKDEKERVEGYGNVRRQGERVGTVGL